MKYFTENNDHLEATFSFSSYAKGVLFVNAVAFIAEKHKHHPEINIDYTKVKISVTTHDAGNTITKKDFALAEAIENLYA
ncbi:MAG: 4a-hydroxytetrahydrobiopterin dehydratase [Flavobacteriales bacterium]|nr:MAG: 4a-hydroxytetrahydrobiopterin dehydratase [Flavobacteriales bacterium]